MIENIITGIEIALILDGAAGAIARLTPTQKDDNWIEKVRGFFEFISNLIPNLERK